MGCEQEGVTGQVDGAVDGDTLAVLSEGIYQEKGGLAGIDAPEDVTPDTGEWLVDTVCSHSRSDRDRAFPTRSRHSGVVR